MNPQAVVVDPLDNQQKTVDRVNMHKLFTQLDALDACTHTKVLPTGSLTSDFDPDVPLNCFFIAYNLQSAHSRIISSDADLENLTGVKFPVSTLIFL